MNTFDIWMWQPPGWPDSHPAVIVSHPMRASRKDFVEVLLCTSQRAGRQVEAHEVVLDQADGLKWPTLCKCDLIYTVPRAALKDKRGTVIDARRGQLIRTMIAAHGWTAVI